MTTRPRRPRRGARRVPALTVVAPVAAIGVLALWASAGLLAQTFRSSVDVIAVDVQVTSRDGRPIANLGPESFEVTLDGRKRRVVSVLFTRHDIAPLADGPRAPLTAPQPSSATSALPLPGASTVPARTFIIAIDTGSFRSLDVRVATLAAERFTRQLMPQDAVGVSTLPNGPHLPPTTRHATARQFLGTIVGRKVPAGQFEMSVEEVIDITAAMANQSQTASRRTVAGIVTQDAGGLGDASDSMQCSGTATACTEQAMNEAVSVAMALEQDVLQGVGGLDSLLRELRESPGRKTVLLLSGGMPVSDRSGGRPSLDDEVKRLGEQATYANATIHTLFFDPSVNSAFSVGSRRREATSGRTRGIYTRALSQFSEPSGGLLLMASTGAGESEIDRLLAQTSTYYVVGVEPEERDRDGRPHRLQVKVSQRDVQVRSRQLVVVPRPTK